MLHLERTPREVIAGDLRRTLEERSFLIPDDDAVRNDFHSMRRTVTAAGHYRFEGEADGSHADRFWAAGLCVHAAGLNKSAGVAFL